MSEYVSAGRGGGTETTACVACHSPQHELAGQVNGYDILRCRACDLRFVAPDHVLVATNYDALYTVGAEYDGHLATARALQSQRLVPLTRAGRRALRMIGAYRPRQLLEVGCGVGAFLGWVESMGVECWGNDISRHAVEEARKHLRGRVHHGELSDDVFPGQQFDIVCAWEVIEHVTALSEFVRTLLRRIRPGGYLFLSTPNCDSPWLWRTLAQDPRGVPPVHVTFWNRRSMGRFLTASGFTEVRVDRLSVPWNPGRLSAVMFGQYLAVADAALRPSSRVTLFAHARVRGAEDAPGSRCESIGTSA